MQQESDEQRVASNERKERLWAVEEKVDGEKRIAMSNE